MKAVEAGEPLPDGDVGIELTRQYYLRVIAARDGSPAAKAGLQTGDYVRAIDGKPTRDMSVFEGTRAAARQAGTKVTLTVIRGNAADPHEVALVREKVGRAARDRAALIGHRRRLRPHRRRSGNGVVEELRKQAADLAKSGAKSLIVDVRRTAEGPLENGIAAARLFVKSGTLAIKAARVKGETARKPSRRAPGDGAIALPIRSRDDGTSSAAELFAASLASTSAARSGPAELFDRRAERQQARGADRRAHARPRRHPEAACKLPEGRAACGSPTRDYLDAPDGEPDPGRGLEPTSPSTSRTSSSARRRRTRIRSSTPRSNASTRQKAAALRAASRLTCFRLVQLCHPSAKLIVSVRPVFSRHRRVAQLVRAPA